MIRILQYIYPLLFLVAKKKEIVNNFQITFSCVIFETPRRIACLFSMEYFLFRLCIQGGLQTKNSFVYCCLTVNRFRPDLSSEILGRPCYAIFLTLTALLFSLFRIVVKIYAIHIAFVTAKRKTKELIFISEVNSYLSRFSLPLIRNTIQKLFNFMRHLEKWS